MKRIISAIVPALLCMQLTAQEYKYLRTCGSDKGEVIYQVTKDKNGTSLFIQVGEQKSYHKLDGNNRNTYWRCVDPGKKMDVEISLENGVYHITGTSNGKKMDKTEESKGLPWYQNLGYLSGTVVPDSGSVRYECFQPGPFSLHQMAAEKYAEDSNATRTCVRAHPAGVASKMYHADYYFSPETRLLIGYKAVEGVPGTPVTTWTLVK